MLVPADAAVVSREPAVPGLALLLDEDALGDWMSHQLGAPVSVRARYLRYKHGTSCVLAAEVGTGSTRRPCLFWAYATTDQVKVRKTLDTAPSGSVLGADLSHGLLATTPAADRDLPALALLDNDDRRDRLLSSLLGELTGLSGCSLRTFRHNPSRRWVALLQLAHRPPVVLRVYPPAALRSATRAILACAGGEPRTPRLLGKSARHGVAAVEYLEGQALPSHDTLRDSADFQTAGAALARLHTRRDIALHGDWLPREVRAVRSAARQLAILVPDLADEAHDLAETSTKRLHALDVVPQPVHGDFSPDQVVVGDDGAAALIDLEAARLGDPADDLACAAAAVIRDVVVGTVTPDTAEQWLEALYSGYTTASPLPEAERLATHQAAHLLRRAVEPFRFRLAPDWSDASRDLVARARRTLAAATAAGGTP